MSKELKIDASKYSRIETDSQKPSAEMLEEIANVFGVSIVDLISGEPLIFQNNSFTGDDRRKIENYYAEQKEVY